MKNLGKILGIILVVALLCSAFILAISAETANEAVIVETGVEYPTYGDAMLAVESGQTVKLLKDVALTAGNGASTKTIVIDLNGYTIDMSGITSGALMNVGQNDDAGKNANITFQNGSIVNGGTCNIFRIENGKDKAVLTVKDVDIVVTAGTEKGTYMDFNDGDVYFYNVNYTLNRSIDNGFFFLRNNANVILEKCNFYAPVGNIGFKIQHAAVVEVINSTMLIETATTATANANTRIIYANGHNTDADGKVTSWPTFISRNSYLVSTSAYYKSATFCEMAGKAIDVKLYDSSIYTSWRVFVGSSLTESAIQGTVYAENTNIGCGILNKNSGIGTNSTSVGSDNCLMRGAAEATFNNCRIRVNSGGDIIWNSGLNEDGTARITYGPGTVIYSSNSRITNLIANTEAGKIWKTAEGYNAYKVGVSTNYDAVVFAAENPAISGLLYNSSTNFDHIYYETVEYDYSYATTTQGQTQHNTDAFGLVMRGGRVYSGHTMSDNNNYFVYTPTEYMTKFAADPYFSLQNLGSKKLAEISYIVLEYDIGTDTQLVPGFRTYVNFRGNNASGKDSPQDGATALTFLPNNDGTFTARVGNTNGETVEFVPGEWKHVTQVYSVADANEAGEINGALSVYIDGKLVGTSTDRPWSALATYISEVRFHNQQNQAVNGTETVKLDNLDAKVFGKDYTGVLSTLFGETPAAVLPEAKEINYSSAYELPATPDIAYVNGAFYDDINEALKAADGEVVELLGDVYATITEAGKVKAGEYTFEYNLDGVYANAADGFVTFGEYTGSEHANIYWVPNLEALEDEEFDWDAALEEVIWGQQLVCPEEYTADYVKDGKVYTLVGFVDDYENVYETLPVSSSAIDEFSFIPVFDVKGDVLFTIEQGDKVVTFGTTTADLVAAFPAIDADAGKAKVTLYGDITAESLALNSTSDLDFDFNGYNVTITTKGNFITTNGQARKVNIYSSKEGAAFYSYALSDGKGGPLVFNNNINNNIAIGDGTNNLSVYAPAVFDTNNSWCAITLNGGTYVRNVSDYGGFLIARGNNTINVHGATIVSTYSANITQSQNRAGSFTFNNTTFVCTNVKGEKANANLIGAAVAGDAFTFNNCQAIGYTINVPAGTTVTVDKNTTAASIAAGVVLPEGYKVALVDREVTATVNYNEFWSENKYEVVAHNLVGNINAALVTEDTVLPEMTGMLQNLTLYAGYNVNLYVPKVEGIVALSKSIDTESLMDRVVTIEGKEYYMITDYVNANAITSDVSFYITFAGEEAYAQKVVVNVVDYAEEILSRGFSDEAKTLMVTMLAYSNEAYTLLNGAANAEIAAIVDANAVYALPEFTVPGEPIDVSVLANAITAAQLNLDASPDFVFTVNKAFAGTITVTYASANGQTVTKTFEVAAVTDEAAAANVITISDIRMYDIGETLNIKATPVEGEAIEGTYNLATYILGLEATDVNASFAKALYAYGVAAALYREYIVG